MKKGILYVSLMLTLTACSPKSNTPLVDSSLSTNVTSDIEYKVEKTILSKGFQSISPAVELMEKDRGQYFLVKFGVVECSTASVDSISRVNNEVNIYTSVKKEWGKKDIVVPQILIKLEDIDDLPLKDLKFNVIPSNYMPIQIKFDRAQVLNKIYTQFKYTANTMPVVSLIKENSEYIWNVRLNNTFLKNNPSSPLFMFKAKINSDSGDILNAQPILLSETIDQGKIIDYAKDSFIAYAQREENDNISSESLWLYDLNSFEKRKIYSTNNSIYSVEFSPDLKKLAIIEYNGKLTDLYVVNLENNLTQKITPMDRRHTWNIKWQNNHILCAVNNDDQKVSSIITLDTLNNEEMVLFKVNLNITNFDVNGDAFVLEESDFTKDISSLFFKKSDDKSRKISSGIEGKFIDDNRLIYRKKVEKEDKYELYIYDLKKNEETLLTDIDTRKFSIINKDTIFIVGKNNTSTDYSIYLYNLKKDESELLGQVLDKNIYYSHNLNTGFFSVVPSSDNADSQFIYGINFDELNEYEKDS